ncbi:type I DNA topoisomerase [Pseudanabaena sp. PCC 6802]|uniref:type I DNA topoisomerase n=1 Tax=Pseudanabaena sp. PCC 6802 TaxID=118173 RepID=UPI00034BEBE8|nr:type I DNA topoisomerase [Pseudanabaena sp. PCC 6802]
MSTLVIVESPTKARTIKNFLPPGYRVEASMGHVRDLPQSATDIPATVKSEEWAKLGVNVDADFEPLYIVPEDKKKVVRELKAALKNASELILATDEDREGESISWHLLQLLQPKVPTKRMVFHEITSEAIGNALQNCRNINEQLVQAQETRRILDRLVGYTVSPLLWKKISWGLSAGRVQSVAVRLIVNRERDRRAFKSGSYWDLKATLFAPKQEFPAQLVSVRGKNIATGKDFDESTGRIAANRNVELLDEAGAIALQNRITGKTWTVGNIEERPNNRKPSPPFTTSTLQQEANRKLRLSARDTMRTAQALYEQGYITYMRTDSVHLSQQAITAARTCVEQMYGANYLSPQPRQYATKSKGAQEAHEAIRPAGETFRTPQQTGLSGRELQLYDLIWKRTVASQMADARQTTIAVQLQVEDAVFRASGKRIDFPGFFRAYVEGSDDPDAAIEGQEVILPAMAVGDHPECRQIVPSGHDTQPPARYTEASLVKTLESEGIGRPSTYASIIGTICDRGYVQQIQNALVPTFTAFAVTALLEEHFPNLVDTGFTSKMEQTLDDISTGSANWLPYLREFYHGKEGLQILVKNGEKEIASDAARTVHLEGLENVKIKLGQYGAYIQVGEGDNTINASIPTNFTPSDLVPEKIETILKQKIEGPDQIGIHPETNEPIFLHVGPYGPYVQLGSSKDDKAKLKRASLPKGMQLEQLTLEIAVDLLKMPRTLGVHPDTGKKVQANLGRFGPYVVHDRGKDGKDYRSLKGDDDPYTITLERALELLAQPKVTRGSAQVLRSVGTHPADEQPVEIYMGKYGPYVKHGKVNVSLPKDSSPDDLTLEQAIALLATKAPAKSSKATASKTTTSKAKTTAKTGTSTKAKTSTKSSTKSSTKTSKTTTTKTTRTRKATVKG